MSDLLSAQSCVTRSIRLRPSIARIGGQSTPRLTRRGSRQRLRLSRNMAHDHPASRCGVRNSMAEFTDTRRCSMVRKESHSLHHPIPDPDCSIHRRSPQLRGGREGRPRPRPVRRRKVCGNALGLAIRRFSRKSLIDHRCGCCSVADKNALNSRCAERFRMTSPIACLDFRIEE